MPGFIAHIGNAHFTFAPEIRKKLVVDYVEGKGFQVERRVVNKFMNDRIFSETPDFFVLVEGVVLNNHELMERYACSSWLDCVLTMYESEGDAFFSAFRGSFSGALLDKKHNKWLIYTCHTGEKQVFVSQTPDGYIFGSEMGFLVDTRKANNLPVSLDESGAYMTITFGFCIEDRTTVEEIKKLRAGHYFRLQNGCLEDLEYHRFSKQNANPDMTVDEAVAEIDHLFRQAVKRSFDKDLEYGYRHIACLSGGLDSRMTVWVAHEMGYTDQLNITYSQSGYLDFQVAQQIASDLNHDFLYKALDGGSYIPRYRFLSSMIYGMGCTMGHGWSMEDLINYDSFGMFHTGQLGDVIIGSYIQSLAQDMSVKMTDGAYSQQLSERLSGYSLKYEYEDTEMFRLYNRGFCGIGQGLLTFQENTESYSPFTDVDMMEFCMTIPLKLRVNHKIYFDWVLTKYPAAAEYMWEGIRAKIHRIENREPRFMTVLGYKVPHFLEPDFPQYLKGFVLRRLGLRKKGEKPQTIVQKSKFEMTPIDYWVNTNSALRQFITDFWEENKVFLPDGQLGLDMRHLYEDCVPYDKLQCLSLLSAIKLIKQ